MGRQVLQHNYEHVKKGLDPKGVLRDSDPVGKAARCSPEREKDGKERWTARKKEKKENQRVPTTRTPKEEGHAERNVW